MNKSPGTVACQVMETLHLRKRILSSSRTLPPAKNLVYRLILFVNWLASETLQVRLALCRRQESCRIGPAGAVQRGGLSPTLAGSVTTNAIIATSVARKKVCNKPSRDRAAQSSTKHNLAGYTYISSAKPA